jgi:hypothetical protein
MVLQMKQKSYYLKANNNEEKNNPAGLFFSFY